MTIGIVGSRGFIGSYLTSYLLARNLGPLRLLARNITGYPRPQGARVLQGDLLSPADCERFAAGLKVIYYLAHNNTPVDSDNDLPSDALNNLVPFLNFLQVIQGLG